MLRENSGPMTFAQLWDKQSNTYCSAPYSLPHFVNWNQGIDFGTWRTFPISGIPRGPGGITRKRWVCCQIRREIRIMAITSIHCWWNGSTKCIAVDSDMKKGKGTKGQPCDFSVNPGLSSWKENEPERRFSVTEIQYSLIFIIYSLVSSQIASFL